MVTKSLDEAALREYLLGMVSEPASEEIERKLLTDNQFVETVELIEDELIDEFLDGGLTKTQRRALETHFLRAPEHRRKLAFARLLRSHLHAEPQPVPAREPWLHFIRSHQTVSVAFACLLAVAVGLGVYAARLREELKSERAADQATRSAFQASMDQEQARAANVKKQLDSDSARTATGLSVVVLDLLAPQMRAASDRKPLECTPGARATELHVALVNGAHSSYGAALLGPDGTVVWSKFNAKPVQIGAGKQLILSIPESLPCHQQYTLILTGQGDRLGTNYPFSVR